MIQDEFKFYKPCKLLHQSLTEPFISCFPSSIGSTCVQPIKLGKAKISAKKGKRRLRL